VRAPSEDGFSLVETMVAILMLSIVSVGFYQVMFSGVRASDTTTSLANVTDEARGGLNRMIRDVREAAWLTAASPTSFTIMVDYDADGTFTTGGPLGDEVVTYAYDDVADEITLNGETLVAGVSPVGGADVFSYTSNRLEYDWGGGAGGIPDGVTTWREINDSSCASHNVAGVGDCDINPAAPDEYELNYLTSVHFSFRTTSAGRSRSFFGEAEMRNRR
jgi:prepilin-type N-terminal cleavage/methylation domain-containing protein